jgi:hypothetical protein
LDPINAIYRQEEQEQKDSFGHQFDIAVDGSNLPVLVIANYTSTGSEWTRFRCRDAELTVETTSNFFKSYGAGELDEFVNSEKEGVASEEAERYGKLGKYVGSDFKKKVYNEEQDVVVLFFNQAMPK